MLVSIRCFIYDFQTLLTGGAAIIIAIFAGIPVWRQLKDTNLQTRISHRETLATLLRDALQRYAKVAQSIEKTLLQATRQTSDSNGEQSTLNQFEAFELETLLRGVLDWYLVVLADTEPAYIETRKDLLKGALNRLVETLSDAYWADNNEQQDEDHNIPDDEWAKIVARCSQAKIEAYNRVSEVGMTYDALRVAQQQWVRSLRTQIARLDLEIAKPRL